MTATNQPPESNEVEFRQQVRQTPGRSGAVRVGIVAGSAILFVIGAVAVMAASPSPSTTTGAAPAASGAPGSTDDNDGPGRFGRGEFGLGGFGRFGFRDITITAINGSALSLKTADGWSRTISVTSTTTITKGGATIAIGDLAVGDQIGFAQDKAADGTYSVTAIVVILPSIGGEVTAINGDTLTVTQPGGTSATIHVDSDTTYQVNGTAGKLGDIKVGSFVMAEGTQRSDGSLDAAAIRSGLGGHGFRGPGFPGGHHGMQDPNASPAPSTSAS